VDGFGPFLDGFQDVADQLARHLLARAERCTARQRETERTWDAERLLARRRRVRDLFLEAIGGLPELPDQVPAEVAGEVAQDGFVVERLLLETLPGVRATANLYLPTPRVGRVPAVLFLCGHAREAKAYPPYQRVCRSLARHGMAVLALDPWGQGERWGYLDAAGKPLVDWGTVEHAYVGLACTVLGANLARYLVADAVQALTYLASRPEVDPERLGVTGSSGGGTQTLYAMAVDDRLRAAAPCTYVTDRLLYARTGQAHDAEQNLWGALSAGLDYAALALPHAPKPLLIGAAASDFFCIEGAVETYERLRRSYALLGQPDGLHLVVAPGPHQFSAALRDAVVAFFRRYLCGEEVPLAPGLTVRAGPEEAPAPGPGGAVEVSPEEEPVLPPEALQVTRSGQVLLDHPQAKQVHDLLRETWASRRAREAATEGARRGRLGRLRAAVLAGRSRPPLWVRETARGEAQGFRWWRRYGFTEPGIAVALAEVALPDVPRDAALAVVAHPRGTELLRDEEGREEVRALAREWGRVLLFDPRGRGAVAQRPVNGRPEAGPFATAYVLNHLALMLGDSLLAMQAFDACRVLEYARRVAREVSVVGEGLAGFVLLVAAAVEGGVRGGHLRGLPVSLEELVAARLYEGDPLLEVHDLLRWPDVEDLVAAVPGLRVTEPRPLARGAPA
jgi:dienelactone hydrolase